VAGLIRRVASWEVFTGCSGAKYPEDAVEDISGVSPGSSPTIFSARRFRNERLQQLPLLVGEIHALFLLIEELVMEPLYPPFLIYEMASSMY
jgi:hypothetical protein